jgi:tRNA(fMet)-specific endonuclease VapC
MTTEALALDTSILVQVFRNDVLIREKVRNIMRIFIPVTVVGEMNVGFYGTYYPEPVKTEFDEFLSRAAIINCDSSAADVYGRTVVSLRKKGSMIPKNDIWIAACCIVADVPLATRDPHFQRVSELRVEMW